MRVQFLFLKFMRNFVIGLTVGLAAAALVAVILFTVYLACYA